MEGFNIIHIESEQKKTAPNFDIRSNSNVLGSTEPEKPEVVPPKTSTLLSNIFFLLSIISFVGVIGYLGFVIYSWKSNLGEIALFSKSLSEQKDKLNKNELQEFINLDKSLKAVKQRLSKHILNTEVLKFVNSNIRTSIAITDYAIEAKEKSVDVTFNSVATSFKDLAEQTERLYTLKQKGDIQTFTVSNVTIDNDSRKIKFTVRVGLDRSKVSALEVSKKNNI